MSHSPQKVAAKCLVTFLDARHPRTSPFSLTLPFAETADTFSQKKKNTHSKNPSHSAQSPSAFSGNKHRVQQLPKFIRNSFSGYNSDMKHRNKDKAL
jgi:surface antigen